MPTELLRSRRHRGGMKKRFACGFRAPLSTVPEATDLKFGFQKGQVVSIQRICPFLFCDYNAAGLMIPKRCRLYSPFAATNSS